MSQCPGVHSVSIQGVSVGRSPVRLPRLELLGTSSPATVPHRLPIGHPPCNSGPALSVPSGVGDGVAVEQAASAKAATPMAIGTNQGTMLPLFERVSLIFIWVRRFGVRTSSRVSQYIFRWEGQLANKGQDQRPDHQGPAPDASWYGNTRLPRNAYRADIPPVWERTKTVNSHGDVTRRRRNASR